MNLAASLLGFLFQTAGAIMLARLLSPKDFGLVAMVTAFSTWIMNFGINGFTEYIIQKHDIDAGEISSIFWLHLFLATTLYLGFVLFGLFLVNFYEEPVLAKIVPAIASSFILYALCTCHFAVLQKEMKYGSFAAIQLVSVVVSTVLSVLVAFKGLGFWAIVTRQLSLPVVSVVGCWMISSWTPRLPKRLSDAFMALKYAIKIYCNFSLSYLITNIDKVFVGRYYGPNVLGNYDRAYYLSQMPAEQLIRPLTSVALATLSRLKGDTERFLRYYTKAVSAVSFLGTVAALVLMLTAQDLVLFLLGPAWTETGWALMALTPGIAALMVSGTISWLHLSLGTPDRWLKWNIFASIFTIVAFALALPYGIVAVSIAYSAKTYFLLIPGLWYAGRPIQLRFRTLFQLIWPYFVSAALVAAIWLYFSSHCKPLSTFLSGLNLLVRILSVGCVASILYLSFIVVIERSLRPITDFYSIGLLFLRRR